MTGGLQKKIKRQACAALNKIQWGSENRMYLVFEWLTVDWTSNGPVIEWFWTHCPIFENLYFTKMSGFRMVGFWIPAVYFGTVKYLTIVIPLNFKALKSCNAK